MVTSYSHHFMHKPEVAGLEPSNIRSHKCSALPASCSTTTGLPSECLYPWCQWIQALKLRLINRLYNICYCFTSCTTTSAPPPDNHLAVLLPLVPIETARFEHSDLSSSHACSTSCATIVGTIFETTPAIISQSQK